MSVRIDKWLWAIRIFKTRALAKKAIEANHVKVNNQKPKPSRLLNINDEVQVEKNDLIWKLQVSQLLEKRVSAKLAVLAYTEEEKYIEQRETKSFENSLIYKTAPRPSKNPDKKARRALINIKKGQL